MKLTIYKLLTLFIVLFLSAGAQCEEEKDSPADYQVLNVEAFNKSVLKGKEDKWTADPVAVSLRFIGPFEGRTQKIERINENPESFDTIQVTIENNGLLDDSVMAIKYKLILKKFESVWIIDSAAKAVKCWPGRGHENYSPEPCS